MKGEERHGVKVFYTGRARGDTSIDPGGEVSIDNPQRGYLTSHPRLLGPWECELALATRPAQLSSIGTRGPPHTNSPRYAARCNIFNYAFGIR